MATLAPSRPDSLPADSISSASPGTLFDCLDQAVATSNLALVKVRDALREVQRVSSAYIETLRATMVAVAGSDRVSMKGSFQKIDAAVVEYLRKIEVEAKIQNDLAGTAAAHCEAILTTAHRITRVAFLARILSLNAAAKSAQIRNSGGLDVIVQELTRLSNETRYLAESAIAAGDQLVKLLPALATLANRLLCEARTFSVSFRESFQALSPAATGLQSQMTDNLADSEQRLQDLIAMSRQAFVALRFEADFIEAIVQAHKVTLTMVGLANKPGTH